MTGYVATRWYRAPEIMLNWMHYNQTGTPWTGYLVPYWYHVRYIWGSQKWRWGSRRKHCFSSLRKHTKRGYFSCSRKVEFFRLCDLIGFLLILNVFFHIHILPEDIGFIILTFNITCENPPFPPVRNLCPFVNSLFLFAITVFWLSPPMKPFNCGEGFSLFFSINNA